MTRHRRPQTGLTLVEMAIVTAIVAVLLGLVGPQMQSLRLRHQQEALAAQLETDLHLARSEAVARNESVRVGFDSGDHGSCYVVYAGPAGACTCRGDEAPSCQPTGAALRNAGLGPGAPVQLASNSATVLFDAVKGTVTPTATLKLQSALGQVRLVVNIMGRIRACSPDGQLPGWRPC